MPPMMHGRGPATAGIAGSGRDGPGDARVECGPDRGPRTGRRRGGTAPSGESDADLPSECQHPVTADGLRVGGADAGAGGVDLCPAAVAVPDEGGRDPAAAGAVPARAPRARAGDRLPVLPHLGRGVVVRRAAADAHLHDAAIRRSGPAPRCSSRCATAWPRTSRWSGAGCTTCPISSTSTTRSTCRRGSAARAATGGSTRCR